MVVIGFAPPDNPWLSHALLLLLCCSHVNNNVPVTLLVKVGGASGGEMMVSGIFLPEWADLI